MAMSVIVWGQDRATINSHSRARRLQHLWGKQMRISTVSFMVSGQRRATINSHFRARLPQRLLGKHIWIS